MGGEHTRMLVEAPAGPRAWVRPAAVRPGVVRVGFTGPFASATGGTERWHDALLPRLKSDPRIDLAGYAVESKDSGPFSDSMAAAGVPLLAGAGAIRELAASVDVLVVWGMAAFEGLLPARGRPKIVAVSHGDAEWTRRWLAAISPLADVMVGVAPAALVPMPADRRAGAVLIPNAVDGAKLVPSASREVLRRRFGWDRPTLLYLGRLSGEKRPGIAVETLSRLDGWKLAYAGQGAEREALGDLAASLGCRDRVEFLGARSDVGDLLHAADVQICPSDAEGFGLSAAEGLWSGCPVVACPVGLFADRAPSKLVGLVPADASPRRWAAAVEVAREDRSRTSKARGWARANLDADAWASRWADLLVETGQAGGIAAATAWPAADPDGPGSILETKLHGWGLVGCGACRALALRMDSLGPAGVLDQLKPIVADIKSRAKLVPEFLIRAGVEWACEESARRKGLDLVVP